LRLLAIFKKQKLLNTRCLFGHLRGDLLVSGKDAIATTDANFRKRPEFDQEESSSCPRRFQRLWRPSLQFARQPIKNTASGRVRRRRRWVGHSRNETIPRARSVTVAIRRSSINYIFLVA
jgi:hypothetical protein